MERPSPDEVRRAGKAVVLGTVLGLVLVVLSRRGTTRPPVRSGTIPPSA